MPDKPNASPEADREPHRDDRSDEAQTNGSSTDVKAPFAPHEDDDSAFGDTDQHSTA